MREVNKELSLEQRAAAQRFFERIGEQDTAHVRRLIDLVDTHADDYFSTKEPDKASSYFEDGKAFFAVYGIGGNLTKEGERPDVDVMIVTNMRYKDGFMQDYDDKMDDPIWGKSVEPLWRRIYQGLRAAMKIERQGQIPDNYNLGLTQGKCVITLTPCNGAKKIDVVYIKSMELHDDPSTFSWETKEEQEPQDTFDYSHCFFISEADFIAKDVGIDGQQLPGVVLYYARTSDVTKQKIKWINGIKI